MRYNIVIIICFVISFAFLASKPAIVKGSLEVSEENDTKSWCYKDKISYCDEESYLVSIEDSTKREQFKRVIKAIQDCCKIKKYRMSCCDHDSFSKRFKESYSVSIEDSTEREQFKRVIEKAIQDCCKTKKYRVFCCHDDSLSKCFKESYSISIEDSTKRETFKWVVEKRIQDYHKNTSTLKAGLLDMVILIVLGLLLILYRPDGINVSFLSINIPKGLLYLIVIFGIIYLWCNFGLEMNSAIDSRLALNEAINSLYGDFHSEKSQHNPSNILVDNAFVDNWCGYYFDIFDIGTNGHKAEAVKALNIFGIFGIFGTLFGVLFGLCLATIIQFGVRMKASNTVANILLIFALGILITSNIVWAFKHYYSVPFVAYIWAVSGGSILIWKFFGLKLAERLERLKNMKEKNGS